jgi:hypothetical protein
VSLLRTLFSFLINERGLRVENPCARFKALRDQKFEVFEHLLVSLVGFGFMRGMDAHVSEEGLEGCRRLALGEFLRVGGSLYPRR